jgi:hypothetical protein
LIMKPLPFWEDRIWQWLSSLLDESRYDVVVCVERKATALLRGFLDLSPDFPLNWSWDRVLSSGALPFLPPGWLDGKRLLVFNEMVHHGRSTAETIDAIRANSQNVASIETAAFAVHEDFYTQTIDGGQRRVAPDHCAHSSISDRVYGIVRNEIIDLLRHKGALLLDTEHLETTFTLTLPFRDFTEALLNCGIPVEYEEDPPTAFPGLTLCEPFLEDLEVLRSTLPVDSDLANLGPRKVRLVRRGPSEFAFIPIWYPAVPRESAREYAHSSSRPLYFGSVVEQCPERMRPVLVFHLAGLVAGLELLRCVWTALSPLVGKGVRPDIVSGSTQCGAPLGHLKALYPLLNFEALGEAVTSAILACQDKHGVDRLRSARKRLKLAKPEVHFVDLETRYRDCQRLFVALIESKDQFSVDSEDALNLALDGAFSTFTWDDFWAMGSHLGIPEPERSILMDTAIDSAMLKTSEMSVDRSGRDFIVRAYEPDSEFARKTLQRMGRGAEEVHLRAS